MTKSSFYYSAKYHNDGLVFDTLIASAKTLPVLIGGAERAGVIVLEEDYGTFKSGLYVAFNGRWRYVMPFDAIVSAQVSGEKLDIYLNIKESQELDPSAQLYKNGQLLTTKIVESNTSAVYVARSAKVISGGGGGGTSGISDILTSGSGVSIVRAVTSTSVTLRTLSAGQNISVLQDGNGGITIASTVDTPPVATNATPGLVKIGAGLIVDSGGMVSLPNNGNTTLNGDATGTSVNGIINVTFANSGVNPGTYTKVTVDSKGRVRGGTNPSTLADLGIVDAISVNGGPVNGTLIMTSGATITGVPNPVAGTDVANRNYVDTMFGSAVNGISWRQAVKAATTANLDVLAGLQAVDGYQTIEGDRVLVKDQANKILNGVYVASAGGWIRSDDADTAKKLLNMATMVLDGTANKSTQWVNNNTSINLGVTAITYAQLRGETTLYSASGGLGLDHTSFYILDTGVAAGSYTRVTVNAKGQVTAGSNLTATDLVNILGYTPYNGSANLSGFLTAATVPSTTLTGDITGSGVGSIATTLATTGVTAGTYTKLTVDTKGRVTFGDALAKADVLTALGYTPVNTALLGAANGVAQLDNNGKVPASQLPSFVDDVIEVANKAALPTTGESGKIYVVDADETVSGTTTQYRWGTSSYIQIVASPGTTDNVPEGTTRLYFTNIRVLNTALTGLSTSSTALVTATDTVLTAIGKLQAQVNQQPYDFTAFVSGKPTANSTVMYIQLGRAITLPANLVGSKIKARTASAGTATFTLSKIVGGVTSTIATITFAAGANVATVSASTDQMLSAGDELLLTTPTVVDTALADIGFVILGSLR